MTNNSAHKIEKVDSKRPVAQKIYSKYLYYLNRGFCKYDCRHVLPASTNLRKDL